MFDGVSVCHTMAGFTLLSTLFVLLTHPLFSVITIVFPFLECCVLRHYNVPGALPQTSLWTASSCSAEFLAGKELGSLILYVTLLLVSWLKTLGM